MNLIRFLSSGSRSLTKGAKPLGRYQLPAGRMLPDFSSPRNPFNKDLSPPNEVSSSEACVTARAASTQAAPPSPAFSSPNTGAHGARQSRPVRQVAAAITSISRRALTVIRQLPRALGKMIQRLRLRRLQRWAPFARSSSARLDGPVQGELALDRVRVVRNDLTDTDYEVVCSETATASPVKGEPKSLKMPVAARPLGQLAERLFNQKVH